MFKKFMQQVDRMLGRGVIDEEFYDELEEALLAADTHITTTTEILEELRKAVKEEKITQPHEMKERLKLAIAERFEHQQSIKLISSSIKPTVYLFVGVNGVGKTTTIAKLANRLKKQGKSVLLAAGDTFRAAAMEQLEVWADRLDVPIVKSQPGADSAALIFDAIQSAKARNIDFVLADTAGRQHSKTNLMGELEKIRRVTEKAINRPPDEVLLVLDAHTGQNALRQTEEFVKITQVSGLVLTKLDGTARGGALIGVFDQFKIPIKLIGIGEKIDQLEDFDPYEFSKGMFED